MEFLASQIAELLNGTVEGDSEITVNKLSKIEEGELNSISFLANPAYQEFLYDTDASIVIVNNDLELERPVKDTCTLIRVENAYECFAKVLEAYSQAKTVVKNGIEPNSYIAKTAVLGDDVYVGAFAYIGENVKIGNNVKIYPNSFVGDNTTIGDNTIVNAGVKIYHECEIGSNCTFHSGVVIGGDGFGFAPNKENDYTKIPQLGNVIIEDHVEIGANTCVDRATMGSTIIKKGAKLDNLIQIGHNVVVGDNTVIVSQTGIAGSTKIGKNCLIGGQVGIVGHLTIADGVKIAAQSGVGYSITEEGKVVQGSPAYAMGEYKRSYVGFRKLPEILERLAELEKQIKVKDI
ncbi:UDP-3-O-(3-hydroxymyristoyl)glucosamine N-acyltransferase [Vicingus serpentipes]|uniref:UDP-3-O-acylglucosamine N-acyltransferase n=1 Tax=Vicingus serpentipes TaxID=1926625 RepID=A0A5C6RVQ4_9FLAO|nr:UDP-3-O-(3-hydroxymyristoyl)glucosamine N-acyltransferase [Vicingus serpentipes]TXB65432.1 UDP-3-O-(3-hydroxymyristoyl)glucosamine N-acyltransferase [Vicingus serpentipes]